MTMFFCGHVAAVGLLPVPVFDQASVQADAQRSSGTPRPFDGEYRYNYTITNPASNTGEIWYFKVDTSAPNETNVGPANPTFPVSHHWNGEFFDFHDGLEPFLGVRGSSVVPIGQKAPPGWNGGFGRDRFAGVATRAGVPTILPGQTPAGFEMTALMPPTLREVLLIPDWILVVENHDDVSDETLAEGARIERELIVKSISLGPESSVGGLFEEWNRLRDELNRTIEIGWFTDSASANMLVLQLSDARAALDAEDGTLARTRLQTLLDTLAQTTDEQRRPEVAALVRLNAEMLIQRTPSTPIPFEPEYIVTPSATEQTLGTDY